jgi:hypothetical protein
MKLYLIDLGKLHQDETAAFIERFIKDYEALNLDNSQETNFCFLKKKLSYSFSYLLLYPYKLGVLPISFLKLGYQK